MNIFNLQFCQMAFVCYPTKLRGIYLGYFSLDIVVRGDGFNTMSELRDHTGRSFSLKWKPKSVAQEFFRRTVIAQNCMASVIFFFRAVLKRKGKGKNREVIFHSQLGSCSFPNMCSVSRCSFLQDICLKTTLPSSQVLNVTPW